MKVYGTVKNKDAGKVVLYPDNDTNVLYKDAGLSLPVTADELKEIFIVGALVVADEPTAWAVPTAINLASADVKYATLFLSLEAINDTQCYSVEYLDA